LASNLVYVYKLENILNILAIYIIPNKKNLKNA
jgi:hypothetical protein